MAQTHADIQADTGARAVELNSAAMTSVTLAGKSACRLGFGCFPLTGGYGAVDRATALRTIEVALDAGVGILDTADVYAGGENERVVGAALKGRRESVVLVTKFGWVFDETGAPIRRDSSPAHVQRACDASLRRLGTDYIDVYLQHRVDPEVPIEATVAALSELKSAGKIRGFGVCEVSPSTLRRAAARERLDVLQTEYSLWSREPEKELLPLCAQLGVAFMAYSPLGRGFLAGGIRAASQLESNDYRRTNPRFDERNIYHNLGALDALGSIARELGCSTAQLTLAWLLHQPHRIVPIPSTRSVQHVRENLEALRINLTPEQISEIEAAVPPDGIHGDRHPADQMKTINL